MSEQGECPYCKIDDWAKFAILKRVNPNGEYVEGYGCVPVNVPSGYEYICRNCSYRFGDKVKRISLPENVSDLFIADLKIK